MLARMGLPVERARSAVLFRSANGRLMLKSRAGDAVQKLSNVCTPRKSAYALLRQLEFAFRSTDILSWGSRASRLASW